MAFIIYNPAWKSASQQKAETLAPQVLAWFQANPNNKQASLAELRAGLPAIAVDLTRPVVNQIAEIIGARLEGFDDPAP